MDYSALSNFGLSKLTIECYEDLFNKGAAKAAELQRRLGRPSSSVYLALSELISKGFVDAAKASSGPTYYFAVPLDEALENFYQLYRMQLSPLIRRQRIEMIKRKASNYD